MGAMMRAHDWSRTPIGPVSSWPQSLRTAVGLLLDSRYPMYIAWGREFTQLYNDGYRPILGSKKHPAALGRSTRETFAEIWDFIGPMFERVMAGGEATFLEDQILPMDRHGYVEECYFTFCYSAIRDESEGVGGVFVTVTETTGRVLGERRLRVLRDLGAIASEVDTAEAAWRSALRVIDSDREDFPFAVLYLLDDDGALVRAGAVGTEPDPRLAPDDAHAFDALWGVTSVVTTGAPRHVTGLRERVGPVVCEPWPEEVVEALVMPIAGHERPLGALVCGLSARRRLDDDYRSFLRLVAGHVGSAILNARAHEEERRRADALAELDRAKTAFFNNVSHEFRTPLTLMLGPLEELLASDRPGPAERASLETAHRNALRQLRLVNTLLDFSRIEVGRMQAYYEPVDLPALTADLASAFRSAVEKAGLAFELDLPALSEHVFVDTDMWEKVVLNLLSNAFKHTFEGRIRVALREADGHALLEVEDTGVGISPEHVERIFERFHRVKGVRARSHEGTGIGLSLVRELVHLHGGDISVRSRVGEGTRFTVRMPFGDAHLPADRVGAARAEMDSVGSAPFVQEALRWLPDAPTRDLAEDAAPTPVVDVRGHGERILVADDNADLRDYIARLLSPHWSVECVADGGAALKAARERQPDLVLADVMMPVMDGFELLRELRADARTRDVPIVLLSARAGEEARVEGLGAGADDYIVKPFGARELIARIAARLELSGERRQAAAERDVLIRQLDLERGKLAELFELAPAFIAVLRGPEHVFERLNENYQQMAGPRPLTGLPVREALPELEGQGYFELLDNVYRSGKPYVGRENRIMIQRSGAALEEHWVNFLYQPLRAADGRVVGIFVHGVDVTEQVRARREAEEANRAKSDFMATISHELRTPLNAIIGYLDLLRLGVPEKLGPGARRHVDRIGSSARHLLQLIEEVLTFTRLQVGGLQIEREEVSLARLMDEVRAMAEPLARQKGLDFRITRDDDAHTLVTDERKLRQVLLNLVGNAVKFTESGHVHLEVERAGERIRFRIADSGVGLSTVQLERAFEPFWQADQSATRPWGGTGLGLAIASRMASLLGGRIQAASEPGRGSVFTFELPLTPAAPETTSVRPAEAAVPDAPAEAPR